MTIYKKRTPSYIYRKIYEQHYGPIPRDSDGKSYDIHHIDGDDSNNNPSNLVALTLKEHYDIHFLQQDYGACNLIGVRMGMTTHELSELSGKASRSRVEAGTHNFLDGTVSRETQEKRITSGTHIFLDNQWQKDKTKKQIGNGTHNLMKRPDGTSLSSDRVKNGTHNFAGENSPTQQKWSCAHCGKTGKGTTNFTRWHGDRCKYHSAS
jgi:hypothetical protein